MSFIRLDLLPTNPEERGKARDRWETDEGRELHERISELIRNGAGEDFLQWDFEKGNLGFLQNYWDLAGFQFFKEQIVFPKGDNFENIDFSYAQFWHSSFTGACFPQTHFSFARLYNITFKNCLFALAHFYGCELEKCTFEDCDFVEGNGFSNCDFKETVFTDCFMSENVFNHCRFDENVRIKNLNKPSRFGLLIHANDFNLELNRNQISGIYRGIKDGFSAGEIAQMKRFYLFLQLKAYTRFNHSNITRKLRAYAWEGVAGYGLRPLRVLGILVILFGLVFFWFLMRIGNVSDSLLLSAGAFLTFGAKAELLQNLSLLDQAVYIGSAFFGVSLVALFITVLSNILLKDN
jgi:hypothetical protein